MPIYIPLVILGAWLIENARTAAHRPRPQSQLSGRRVGFVIAVALFGFYGAWFAQSVWNNGSIAHGFAAPSTVDSPLAQVVKHLPANALVVSNAPWALYYASGHQPVVPQPGPLTPAASLVPPTIRQLSAAQCSRAVYVAWYGELGDPVPAGVFPGLALDPIQTVRDGALYRVAVPKPVALHLPPNQLTAWTACAQRDPQ